jgi:hypothetical protein
MYNYYVIFKKVHVVYFFMHVFNLCIKREKKFIFLIKQVCANLSLQKYTKTGL